MKSISRYFPIVHHADNIFANVAEENMLISGLTITDSTLSNYHADIRLHRLLTASLVIAFLRKEQKVADDMIHYLQLISRTGCRLWITYGYCELLV